MSMEIMAWARAEQLARRICLTWDPAWRQAFESGFLAIGSGSEAHMEEAMSKIERLARTL
jgi:hypothetical protein